MEQTPLALHAAFLSPEELEQMTLSLGADMGKPCSFIT